MAEWLMEVGIKELVVAVVSAGFTLFITWFGSHLTSKSDKKRSSELLKHQISSLKAEMADLTSMVEEIHRRAYEALDTIIETKEPQSFYVSAVETPIYSELFKVVHLNYSDIERKNIRHFYNYIGEINTITERCRNYTHTMKIESRVIADIHFLKIWCTHLEALNRHMDKEYNPEDVEFILKKKEANMQYLQALEAHFINSK